MRRPVGLVYLLAHYTASVCVDDSFAATDPDERNYLMSLFVDLHGWIEGYMDARIMGEGGV